MKQIYFLTVLFGALLFCACEKENMDPLVEDQAQSQIEESALKGAKKHTVPFKSVFIQRQITEDWSGFPEDYFLTMEGEGTATHLGKTTLLIDQHWDFTQPAPPEEPEAEGVGYGIHVFISANGDELHGDYVDYNKVEIWAGPNPAYIIVWGSGTFNGGTGRFMQATGNYTFSGDFVAETGLSKVSYRGEIQY